MYMKINIYSNKYKYIYINVYSNKYECICISAKILDPHSKPSLSGLSVPLRLLKEPYKSAKEPYIFSAKTIDMQSKPSLSSLPMPSRLLKESHKSEKGPYIFASAKEGISSIRRASLHSRLEGTVKLDSPFVDS